MVARAEPLVGRQAELELLAASLEAAAEGRPRFLLVTGEAGIGKTSLLREAAGLAGPFGLRVLSGTSIEGGVALPYLPLLAPLAACVEGATDPASETVRRLVAGESSPGRSDAAGAARLVEAVFAVLVREPTLLVVDDAHWADGSTVTVLDYLSHRARSEALAVLVAARDDEPDRLARLPIADGRRFVPLRLARLTETEVGEQVTALVGSPAEPELVSSVFERSAGNPFFVEQLVAEAGGGAPASLRALVLHRLAELPDDVRNALDALAVLGRPGDEALLGSVASLEPQEADGALRVAAGLGVTITADEGFAFRHPIFAEVVLGELPGFRRRQLHGRAAEALAAIGADIAEQATHWWEAEDAPRAWSSALEAAERTERAYAFAETRLHLERALEVWPEGVDGRVDCLLRAADAAWLTGDAADALALAQRAVDEGAPQSPTVHLALGGYAWDAAERELSTEAFERAAALVADDTPAATRSRLLWAQARARIGERRYSEAVATAGEAARVAAEAGDGVAEARALFTAGSALAWQGSLAGIADIERGVALAVEAGSPVAIGHGYLFLSSLLLLAGDLDRTVEVSLEGVEACERVGLARSHGSDVRAQAAFALIELGRWDEADEVLEPAEPRAQPLLARALLAMRRGNLTRAASEIGRAADAATIGGPGALAGELELARAELAWLAGDFASARAALDEVHEVPGVWGVVARAGQARLAARLAADDARRPAPQAPDVHHPDRKLDAALRAEIQAERARTSGDADPQLWRACVSSWDDARRPYDRAYAALREAEALFAGDERDSAKAVLREAAASAASLGAGPLRVLAEDLARRARVSPDAPRRREPDRDEPTARELEVLAFLADGLTNREIAARLFLSPKTVGIHVSRILRKLDAHTRGEAVAVARRRGLLGSDA